MKYLTFNNIIRAEIKLKDTEGHFSHIWTKFFDHYLILKKVFYSIYEQWHNIIVKCYLLYAFCNFKNVNLRNGNGVMVCGLLGR